jgi:hypothetical protein
MSGISESNLIFSNQKLNEPEHSRDFSPDFQTLRHDTKAKNNSKKGNKNGLIKNAINSNCMPKEKPSHNR